jgi:hypothetical protein
MCKVKTIRFSFSKLDLPTKYHRKKKKKRVGVSKNVMPTFINIAFFEIQMWALCFSNCLPFVD